MTRARRFKDRLVQGVTWLMSGVSLWVLIAILVFIGTRGWKSLNWSVLSGDYDAKSIVAAYETVAEPGRFERPSHLEADAIFSARFGFAVEDLVDHNLNHVHRVTYVADDSPLKHGTITTAGPLQGTEAPFNVGMSVHKLVFRNAAGEAVSVGRLRQQTPDVWVPILDGEAVELAELYANIPGGGIRGSILATLMLIGLSMLFAAPIGIFAAIYLHSIAKQNKATAFIRSSIELLAGVPSIIFSMMGITLLYPIVKAFGISGQSVLLGSLTMAVVLLPILIRQAEEALMAVPMDYTMASLALGATKTETLFRVVLPGARNGILSAFLLAISRVIGESAALIFTMGTAINDAPEVTSGATSLAVHIWVLMGGENPNFELASTISIVILIIVLALNLLVKIIAAVSKRTEKANAKAHAKAGARGK
ncbi:MAG: PstA family ABC transporter permease [Saccharofermentanales bacterium]|jgi:phosphate transport system permease protein